MRVSVEYAQEHFMELLDAVDRGIDVLIEASNGKLYRLELVERPTSG
jgi:antitoxin (DNA-binding transcriptional repressor) of toxin-antitoxin stability system